MSESVIPGRTMNTNGNGTPPTSEEAFNSFHSVRITPEQLELKTRMMEMATNACANRWNSLLGLINQNWGDGTFEAFWGRLSTLCGYTPYGTTLAAQVFRSLYDMEGVATRVVDILPDEVFQVTPTVYEDEDTENETEFELAWDALGAKLQGNSKYKDEEYSCVWDYIKRGYKASRIGRFGLILLGLNDGQLLETPVPVSGKKGGASKYKDGKPEYINDGDKAKDLEAKKQSDKYIGAGGSVIDEGQYIGSGNPYGDTSPPEHVQPSPFVDSSTRDITGISTTVADGGRPPPIQPISTSGTDEQYQGVQFTPMRPYGKSNDKLDLVFLRVFDESLVQVVQYEADLRSPRFGLPVMYLVTLNDPRQVHTGVGLPLATVRVHWSRVIHIPADRLTSEIFGYPAMQRNFHRLLDYIKLMGGSAEMYWRGAFPGLSIESHPGLGGDVSIDKIALSAAIDDYFVALNRVIATTGMSVKSLAPQVVDPTPQVEIQLQAMCIYIAVPKRIFMGSERGELASSQDKQTWNERLTEIAKTFVTPVIIREFVDRLIQMDILPEPKEWHCRWPDRKSTSATEQAQIIATMTQAISTYITAGCNVLIDPLNFFVHVVGWDEELVRSILESTQEHMEEAYPDEENPVPGSPPGAGDQQTQPTILDPGQSMHDPETGDMLGKSPHKPLQPPPQAAPPNGKPNGKPAFGKQPSSGGSSKPAKPAKSFGK